MDCLSVERLTENCELTEEEIAHIHECDKCRRQYESICRFRNELTENDVPSDTFVSDTMALIRSKGKTGPVLRFISSRAFRICAATAACLVLFSIVIFGNLWKKSNDAVTSDKFENKGFMYDAEAPADSDIMSVNTLTTSVTEASSDDDTAAHPDEESSVLPSSMESDHADSIEECDSDPENCEPVAEESGWVLSSDSFSYMEEETEETAADTGSNDTKSAVDTYYQLKTKSAVSVAAKPVLSIEANDIALGYIPSEKHYTENDIISGSIDSSDCRTVKSSLGTVYMGVNSGYMLSVSILNGNVFELVADNTEGGISLDLAPLNGNCLYCKVTSVNGEAFDFYLFVS